VKRGVAVIAQREHALSLRARRLLTEGDRSRIGGNHRAGLPGVSAVASSEHRQRRDEQNSEAHVGRSLDERGADERQ
jgi:hypothetical protein